MHMSCIDEKIFCVNLIDFIKKRRKKSKTSGMNSRFLDFKKNLHPKKRKICYNTNN